MLGKIVKFLASRFNTEEPRFQILKTFKSFLMFSFILWFSIIIWNIFQDYKILKNLEAKKGEILKQLKEKEKVIKEYEEKVNDIKLAYTEISHTISSQKVKKLLQQINDLVFTLQKQKANIELSVYNPYKITGFNIKFALEAPSFIQSISLKDIDFSSWLAHTYKAAIQTILDNWDKKIYTQPFHFKVSVESKKNKIILYLKKDKTGFISISPIVYYGLIVNPIQTPYFLTSTALNTFYLQENIKYAPLFIGWDLNLKLK